MLFGIVYHFFQTAYIVCPNIDVLHIILCRCIFHPNSYSRTYIVVFYIAFSYWMFWFFLLRRIESCNATIDVIGKIIIWWLVFLNNHFNFHQHVADILNSFRHVVSCCLITCHSNFVFNYFRGKDKKNYTNKAQTIPLESSLLFHGIVYNNLIFKFLSENLLNSPVKLFCLTFYFENTFKKPDALHGNVRRTIASQYA